MSEKANIPTFTGFQDNDLYLINISAAYQKERIRSGHQDALPFIKRALAILDTISSDEGLFSFLYVKCFGPFDQARFDTVQNRMKLIRDWLLNEDITYSVDYHKNLDTDDKDVLAYVYATSTPAQTWDNTIHICFPRFFYGASREADCPYGYP